MRRISVHILFFLIVFGYGYAASGQEVSIKNLPKNPPDSVRVHKIFVVGNKKTQENIILRELDFMPGYTYDWDTFLQILEADQNKIYNLRLFTEVEINPLFREENEIELLIKVQERWYVVPSLIFQLADRNFSEWWTNQNRDFSRVNYGLRITHGNVGGRNERFRFSGQLGFTKALQLRYSKPYIDKNQKHGLAGQFSFFEQKTIPLQSANNRQVFFTNENENILRKNLSAALQYTFRRTFYNFHFFTLGFSSTRIHPEVLERNPDYFLHGDTRLNYLFMNYTFRHDKRDLIAYATEGELIELSATKYGILSTESIDEIEVEVTANKYFHLSDRLHIATGLNANWFLSQNQPYSLVRGIGYAPNFIRGYELNVIEGQQLYVHKNSLRWKFIDWKVDISRVMPLDQFNTIPFRFYLSANFDHGYVGDRNRLPINSRLTNTYLFGYGLGIDLVGFYDAVFRFEYSLNNSGEANFFLNLKAPF